MHQDDILNLLKDGQYHTIIEMRMVLGTNSRSLITNKLYALERQGYVEKKILRYTKGKLAYWRLANGSQQEDKMSC